LDEHTRTEGETRPEAAGERPARRPASAAFALQRAAGNRAVAALIQRAPDTAQRVLRQPHPVPAPPTTDSTPTAAHPSPTTTGAPGTPPAAAAAAPAPTAQQQAAHDTAVADHHHQQERVYALIARGLRTRPRTRNELDHDALFRNACQWIDSGRVTLKVLSLTNDAGTRRAHQLAYFDTAVTYPTVGGDYPIVPGPPETEAQHVQYAHPAWNGGTTGNTLSILRPAAQTDQELITTIIHEVQHNADESTSGQGATGPARGRSPGDTGLSDAGDRLLSSGLFSNYQTEFRAHWLETPEGGPADEYGSSRHPARNSRPVPGRGNDRATTNFRNLRQENIFWKLVRMGYEVADPYAGNPAFKQMVDDFDRPVGLNVVNSVRVRAALDALDRATTSMDASAAEVQAVLTALSHLDATDRAFLSGGDSRPFWDYAATHVSAEVLTRLRSAATGRSRH
jgi:hypothetical protein